MAKTFCINWFCLLVVYNYFYNISSSFNLGTTFYAIVGLYSPYLASIAQEFGMTYYVVGSNDNTTMPLNLIDLYYLSQVYIYTD